MRPILAATSRGLLESVDGGATWKLITAGVPAATVNSVRFHPAKSGEAFLVQYGKSTARWTAVRSWELFPSEGLGEFFGSHLVARARYFRSACSL